MYEAHGDDDSSPAQGESSSNNEGAADFLHSLLGQDLDSLGVMGAPGGDSGGQGGSLGGMEAGLGHVGTKRKAGGSHEGQVIKRVKAFQRSGSNSSSNRSKSSVLPWSQGTSSATIDSLSTSIGMPRTPAASLPLHLGDYELPLDLASFPDLASYSSSSIEALGLEGIFGAQQSLHTPSSSSSHRPALDLAVHEHHRRADNSASSLPSSAIDPLLYPPGSAEQIAAQARHERGLREDQEDVLMKELFGEGGRSVDKGKERARGNGNEGGGDYEVEAEGRDDGEYAGDADDARFNPSRSNPATAPGSTSTSFSSTSNAAPAPRPPLNGPTAREAATAFQGDEERPHKCPSEGCDKKFSRKSDFLRHYRIHTGERPFVCDHEGCGKSFIQRSALTVHSRVHSGEKPHACKECPREFSDSSSLARHRRVHAGLKPFKCEKCNVKAFSRKATLNRHLTICSGAGERSAPKPKTNKTPRPRLSKTKQPKMHPSVNVPADGSPAPSSSSSAAEEEEEEDASALPTSIDPTSPAPSARRNSVSRVAQQAEVASAATSATRTEVMPVPRPVRSDGFDEMEGVRTDEQQAARALVSGFGRVEGEECA